MTNGENLKNIYPDLEIISEIKDVYVIMLEAHNVWSPKLEVFKSWWNAEYKEPSNSEKPNELVEEKCPCYDCEHFEIKGWSHCKIHEDAYGNIRCTDYHKVNQSSNNSENPISSTTKNGISNRTIIYKAKGSKNIQEDLEKLEKLNEPTTKNDLGVDDEERELALMYLEQIKEDYIEGVGYERHLLPEYYAIETAIKSLALPSIRPKGRWIKTELPSRDAHICSECGGLALLDECGNEELTDFCPHCGSDNREVVEE